MNIPRRAWTYFRESVFCVRAGAGWREKWKLLYATAAFHLRGCKGVIHEIAVNVGPLQARLKLRGDGGDMFIFHEVLGDQVYDVPPGVLRNEPKVIVDLGANIGLSTLAFAGKYPTARIVCVEPHPENAKLLRNNVSCLGDRVQVIEAAIADRPGNLRLALAPENYNASLVRQSDQGVEVRAVTMEQVMAEFGFDHIDLLKMDIEGAERLILPLHPAWLKQVDVILAELHDYSFADFQRDVADAGLTVHGEGAAQAVAYREPETQSNPFTSR